MNPAHISLFSNSSLGVQAAITSYTNIDVEKGFALTTEHNLALTILLSCLEIAGIFFFTAYHLDRKIETPEGVFSAPLRFAL